MSKLEIQTNVDLTGLNTMGISAKATWFVEVSDLRELEQALNWADAQSVPVWLLGGGSNVIFAGNFEGLVIRLGLRGRSWANQYGDSATLVLAAGENWHNAVIYACQCGYRGLENLALIPGSAGAAPVQNIGAYGTELADTLESVRVWDRQTGTESVLDRDDCQFSYRDSLFKQMPDRYVILDISLRLDRNKPLNLGYRELADYFAGVDSQTLSAEDVAEAVMCIRQTKLPDPDRIPNAGSFFKNPVVPATVADQLLERFPGLVTYTQADGQVKLAAGWLIDQRGWKGFSNGVVGVHHRQALVLTNHGGSGRDVLALAARIADDIAEHYGVELEIEPRIAG